MVIYRKERIEDALEHSENRRAKYGSRRNLIGKQCSRCFMSFETMKRYPKQVCQLCRYEILETKKAKRGFLTKYASVCTAETWEDKEAQLYEHYLGRGIELQRRKERTMRAKGVTFKRVLSERMKPFLEHFDN